MEQRNKRFFQKKYNRYAIEVYSLEWNYNYYRIKKKFLFIEFTYAQINELLFE